MLLQLSNISHPSSSLLPLQRPKQSPLSSSSFFFFSILFTSFSLSHAALLPPSAFFPFTIILSMLHQLLLLRFQPLFLLLLLFLYMGNTRKPEKVEYFHPPIRFPLSNFR